MFLPGEPHGHRSLVGYTWGHRVGHDWNDLARMHSPMVQPRVEMSHLKMLPAFTGGPLLCLVSKFREPSPLPRVHHWGLQEPIQHGDLDSHGPVGCSVVWSGWEELRTVCLTCSQALSTPRSGHTWALGVASSTGTPSSVICHVTLHRTYDKVYQKKIPSLWNSPNQKSFQVKVIYAKASVGPVY